MIASLTDKLKNQHLTDPPSHISNQDLKSKLKSKPKISERKWSNAFKDSRIKKSKVKNNATRAEKPDCAILCTIPSSEANSSLGLDPPKKKLCRNHEPCDVADVPVGVGIMSNSSSTLSTISKDVFTFSSGDSFFRNDDHTLFPICRSASISGAVFTPNTAFKVSGSGSLSSSLCFRSLSLDDPLPKPLPTRRDNHILTTTNHISRCHSQPCVMYDRKCGVKRRRDKDRPALDFDKMTETAYQRSCISDSGFTRVRHKSACYSRQKEGLLPIASSPSDNDISQYKSASPEHSPLLRLLSMGVDAHTDSGCSDLDERDTTSFSATYNSSIYDISADHDDSLDNDIAYQYNTDVEESVYNDDDSDNNVRLVANVNNNNSMEPVSVFGQCELDIDEIESH